MSMTESEAKVILETELKHHPEVSIFHEALSTAIHFLEEIQQYRTIGTVSEFRELKEKATAKKVFLPFGTHSYKCPSCWKFVAHEVDDNCDLEATMADYCPYCGQHLDWSEGKE